MSRSYKKPYVSIVCHARGSMKKWKKQCNRKIRHTENKVDDRIGNKVDMIYKKINNPWLAPNDGKSLWDKPRFRRK